MSPGGGCIVIEAGSPSHLIKTSAISLNLDQNYKTKRDDPFISMQHQSPPHSPGQIKEKLLQALDRDYHVVDMALALEAVSLLEKTAVTKEALETTRLGRLVNEMRKKTQNDSLARRAKDLVRRWRDMVQKPAENGTGGTGQGPGIQGALMMNHLRVAGVKNSVSSPALSDMDRMNSCSPALMRPVHSMVMMNPASTTSPAFRGISGISSPALQHRKSTGVGVQQHQPSHISPSNSVASNASTSPGLSFSLSQTHSNSSRPSTPSSLVVKNKAISPGPGRPSSIYETSNNNQPRGLKRTRTDQDEDTMTGFEFAAGKRLKGTNGGAGEWPWNGTDECSRESNSNLSWSGDSSRMMNNHGGASAMDDRSSSSKPPRHFRPGGKAGQKTDLKSDVLKEQFASIARHSKVKTTQELLEDLARRSGSPNLMANRSNIDVQQPEPCIKQEILAKFFQSTATVPDRGSRTSAAATLTSSGKGHDPVADIYARLPPLDPAKVASLWPEKDEEVGEIEENPEPPPTVSGDDVELLHNGQVENVNGTRDWTSDFHPWHETLSVTSYHGDPLHLLPYVVIE